MDGIVMDAIFNRVNGPRRPNLKETRAQNIRNNPCPPANTPPPRAAAPAVPAGKPFTGRYRRALRFPGHDVILFQRT